MSRLVGATSAHLPDDATTTRLGDALLDAALAPTGHGPATTTLPVQRPVPRPKHTAAPASPVGRANRHASQGTTSQGPASLLASHGIPDPDTLPDPVLHALTERLLEVKHARIARWRALGGHYGPPGGTA